MTIFPLIDCGGFRTVVHPDTDTAGGSCYVASHPDLDGATGYGATMQEAVTMLVAVRTALIAAALRFAR